MLTLATIANGTIFRFANDPYRTTYQKIGMAHYRKGENQISHVCMPAKLCRPSRSRRASHRAQGSDLHDPRKLTHDSGPQQKNEGGRQPPPTHPGEIEMDKKVLVGLIMSTGRGSRHQARPGRSTLVGIALKRNREAVAVPVLTIEG